MKNNAFLFKNANKNFLTFVVHNCVQSVRMKLSDVILSQFESILTNHVFSEKVGKT